LLSIIETHHSSLGQDGWKWISRALVERPPY
jgi:hypothetical protein